MCSQFESECARRLAEETEYLSIEKNLDDMDEAWRSTDLVVVPHKDSGHHTLMATDEQFQQLEDHRKAVSSMKASRFSLDFAGRLIFWENARLAANPHLGLRSTLNARRD